MPDAPRRPNAAPAARTSWLDRPGREPALIAALALLAFGLRVAHVLGSQASPLFDAPQMDALYHVEWARAFAAGERFQPPPFFRAPLYPWFLGSLFAVFGDGLLLPRLVQAGFGAAATLLVVLIGRRAFDRATGLVAGLLWATSWVSIFFDGELLLETLAIPLSLLGLWLTLGLAREASPRRCAVAGLAWGLSAVVRPNVLLLMPLLALWLWLRARGTSRGLRTLLAPAWLAAGTFAPILPVSAYNLVAGGDTVLIASQAGLNLWIGNNPASDGSTAVVPGTREDWWGGHHDAIAQAEQAEGRALRPSEVSGHFTRRALAFVREQPGAWLRLTAHKLRLFTWDHELGNNEEPRFLFERFSPLAPLGWVGFGVLLPLALVGLLATWRGAWARLPLWGFLAAYSLSVVAFFVNARFRLPVLPAFALYAAAGSVWAARAWRRRAWTLLGPAAAGVVAFSVWCHAVPASVLERSRSNGRLILGTSALQQGEPGRAASLLQEAVGITPSNSIAWRTLAFARRATGDEAAAERAFEEALRLRPDDADALDGLSDLLLFQGRDAEAEPLALRLERAEPSSPRGPYALGRARFGRGELGRAAEDFTRALERSPRHFGAAYALGLAQLGLERSADAAGAFERALEADPPEDERFLLDAFRRAIELRAQLGLSEAARATLSRMQQRFPDHPLTRELAARL